jgi:NAD(P)-dependent dehydrogenase (short-subunit alcohol dehydrogenase family)
MVNSHKARRSQPVDFLGTWPREQKRSVNRCAFIVTYHLRSGQGILTRYEKIDVLLNNAGYGLFGPIEALAGQQIQQQFATNLFGLIGVTQQVLPAMREAGGGLIINVSSIVGRFALYPAHIYRLDVMFGKFSTLFGKKIA